jgi:PKD repeat protein
MKQLILLFLLFSSFSLLAEDSIQTEGCKADFKFEHNPDIMTLVPGAAINFYDTSEGNVLERYWDFGDGHSSTEKNPMFVFTYPLGGPNVKLNPYRKVSLTIVSDSCKSTLTQTINIYEIADSAYQYCEAVFRYYELEKDSLSQTVKIQFDNYSSGKELSYFWQFDNGTTSTEKAPVVKFSMNEPEYKVCLTVMGSDSCISTMCDVVYLNYPPFPECEVEFGYEKKDILMTPLPSVLVYFYAKSSPEAVEWYWDFGDGTTSREPNPIHTYIQEPILDSVLVDPNPFREVCLTVVTENGCKTTRCEVIPVFTSLTEPEKCNAYFKYYFPEDILSIPEVVPIQLVDVTEGEVISRLWQFEDGSTSTEKEPLISFDAFQREHKVCLTVTFADSCISTFCDAVYLFWENPDTIITPECPYTIKVDGGFPIELSSCAGWASASVYLNDSLVEPKIMTWSNGDESSKTEGLCPTQTYAVKALMHDGCTVKTEFILSADGTITVVKPVIWSIVGEREKLYIRSETGAGLKVEWLLCDGTIVEADSIPLDAINCGGEESNMIVKDSLGNVVYSELISLKGTATGIEETANEIKLWPNPVSDKINLRYSGEFQPVLSVEFYDMTGKKLLNENFKNILNGQELSVETNHLKPGIYVCRISANGLTILTETIKRQ